MTYSRPARFDIVVAVPAAIVAGLLGSAVALWPVWTVLALAAVVVLAITALRADLLLIGFVAVMPWEGLLAGGSEVFTPTRLAGALLAVGFVYRLAARRVREPVPAVFLPLGILVLCVVLSTLVHGVPEGSVDTAFRYASAIAFFFFAVQLVDSRKQAELLLAVYAASVALAATWGIVAFLTAAEPSVQGPIQNPNDFAFVLGSALPILMYFSVVAGSRLRRFAWLVGTLVTFAAVAGTLSRGALAAAVVVVLWALFTRRLSIPAVAGAAVAAVLTAFCVYALNPELIETRLSDKSQIAEENVSSRESFWEASLTMSADNPVLGVGPGQFDANKPEYVRNDPTAAAAVGTVEETSGAHNTYLSILSEVGPVALAAFLAFLVQTWLVAARRRRATGADDRLIDALQAALLFAAVASLFIAVQYEVPFWLVGALAVVLSRGRDAGEEEPADERNVRADPLAGTA